MGNQPLILQLLKVPYFATFYLVRWLSLALATPVLLYPFLTKSLVNTTAIRKSRTTHLLLWFPRWLLSTLFVPYCVALIAGGIYSSYWLSSHEGSFIATIATLSGATVIIGGVVRGIMLHNSSNTFLQADLKDYMHNTLDAQKDLGAFLCCVIVIATLIRIPQLVYWLRDKKKKNPFISFCYRQILFVLVDYFCLPFLLVILITMWRFPEFKKEFKARSDSEVDQRLLVIVTALNVLLDLPFFLLAIPVIVTLWRLPLFITRLRKAGADERRMVCLVEFGLLLWDLPFLLMLLITTVIPWGRGLLMWKQMIGAINKRKSASAKSIDKQIEGLQGLYSSLHSIIGTQFCCAVLDVLAVVAALFVVLFIWNAKDMYRAIKAADKTSLKLHSAIFQCFFTTINDSPYILFALLTFLTPWRSYNLYNRLKTSDGTLSERRRIVLDEFLKVLFDIPALLAYGIVCITQWQYRAMKEGLKNTTSWHNTVFRHLLYLVLDTPALLCIALVTVTLWRSWLIWRLLWNATGSDALDTVSIRRYLAYEQFGSVLVDIPCLVCALYVAITVWHLGP